MPRRIIKIRLKGELHTELKSAGCKAGDVFEGIDVDNLSTGCVHFTKYLKGFQYNCSVWPENYDEIKEEAPAGTMTKDQALDLYFEIEHTGLSDALSTFEKKGKLPQDPNLGDHITSYKEAKRRLLNYIVKCANQR